MCALRQAIMRRFGCGWARRGSDRGFEPRVRAA